MQTIRRLFVTQFALVLIAAQMMATELACQDSGFCSLGKVAPFVGDLYQSEPVQLGSSTK